MADKAGNDFIVKLDGLSLTQEAAQSLAREIQSLVLRELARIDLGGDLHAHIPRREWYGIWLAKVKPQDINTGVLRIEELRR
jgi:hypothetical protein